MLKLNLTVNTVQLDIIVLEWQMWDWIPHDLIWAPLQTSDKSPWFALLLPDQREGTLVRLKLVQAAASFTHGWYISVPTLDKVHQQRERRPPLASWLKLIAKIVPLTLWRSPANSGIPFGTDQFFSCSTPQRTLTRSASSITATLFDLAPCRICSFCQGFVRHE